MIRYSNIVKDITTLPIFVAQYEKELIDAKKDCMIKGNIEHLLKYLPGNSEHRFNQLQEIEAVLHYLGLELRKLKQYHYKKYIESYAKALTSRDAEKYAYAENEVVDLEVMINEVALLRNKFVGITKGLESKGFQLNAIVKIRAAAMEDVTL